VKQGKAKLTFECLWQHQQSKDCKAKYLSAYIVDFSKTPRCEEAGDICSSVSWKFQARTLIDIHYQVTLPFPWAFCGQLSTNSKCKIRIGKGGKASLDCPLAYGFLISAAAKVFQAKQYTNVPVLCKFCSEVHWKYNIHQHLSEQHRGWRQCLQDDIEFLNKIAIVYQEEAALGIPEE
jgi:hypothetical protein